MHSNTGQKTENSTKPIFLNNRAKTDLVQYLEMELPDFKGRHENLTQALKDIDLFVNSSSDQKNITTKFIIEGLNKLVTDLRRKNEINEPEREQLIMVFITPIEECIKAENRRIKGAIEPHEILLILKTALTVTLQEINEQKLSFKPAEKDAELEKAIATSQKRNQDQLQRQNRQQQAFQTDNPPMPYFVNGRATRRTLLIGTVIEMIVLALPALAFLPGVVSNIASNGLYYYYYLGAYAAIEIGGLRLIKKLTGLNSAPFSYLFLDVIPRGIYYLRGITPTQRPEETQSLVNNSPQPQNYEYINNSLTNNPANQTTIESQNNNQVDHTQKTAANETKIVINQPKINGKQEEEKEEEEEEEEKSSGKSLV